MLSDIQKGIIVTLFSLFISLLVLAGGYEWYQGMKYDNWKTDYQESGNWYGKLTIPSDNEIVMWEYRPNGQFENIRTNGFGYRDEDYPTTTKPDGVYRVAFIGDSVTLGLEANYEDIFVRRFEAWAQQQLPNKKVQALNFGVDGYNILQIQETLKAKTLAYAPDKVVYVMSLNDFDFADASGDKVKYFRKPDSFLRNKLEQLYRRLSNKDYYTYYFDKNRDQVYATIIAMQQLLEQRGIDFQVALLPIFTFSQPNFDHYPPAPVHAQVMQFLQRNGIANIDLLAAFKTLNGPPKRYGFDGWHPNALGHQIIAEQLHAVLNEASANVKEGDGSTDTAPQL